MTIDEIKSVSIIQFLETQGYHKSHVLKGNYWYLSPFRSEQSPSPKIRKQSQWQSQLQ